MRYRVALVASHVIQYQAPFFRKLAEEPSIDLTVYYCSRAGAERYRDVEMDADVRWDVDLLAGYRYRFLANAGFGHGYARAINPGITTALLFGPYDAAIFFLGWGTMTSLLGIAACRARAMPFFLFGDSSFPPPEESPADRLRAGFLRGLFRMTSGFLVSGRLNADYYAHYGADRSRFFLVPWAVDNERFELASRLGREERRALRARVGAKDGDVLFVYSAKLLPRKDPMALLRGLDAMRFRDRAAVLFLGDGELRAELQGFAAARGLRAHFAGFVNQADLPRWYAAGDVFVLPSLYEPRGAVINEAMACGLPLIVTDRCGSLGDIAIEGENAMVYPAGEARALAERMDAMVEDPRRREAMAERSRALIARWDYRRGVEGVLEAFRTTLGGRS